MLLSITFLISQFPNVRRRVFGRQELLMLTFGELANLGHIRLGVDDVATYQLAHHTLHVALALDRVVFLGF